MLYEDDFTDIVQTLPDRIDPAHLPGYFPGTKEEQFHTYITSGKLQAVYKNRNWYVTREGLARFLQKHSILNEP